MNTERILISICALALGVCLASGCTSARAMSRMFARTGSLPPAKAGAASSVLIDKTEPAYTVFMTVPTDKEQEVRTRVAGKKGVTLVDWAEFSRTRNELISSNMLTNEYHTSRTVDGLYELLERAPGVPFGLTWNGGIAFTRNDYQYTKKTFEQYKASPGEYRRTRPKDPRADPVRPECHFGPLLGW